MVSNYIKVKIDNMQQNRKYRLCGDKHETLNPYKQMQQTSTKGVQD